MIAFSQLLVYEDWPLHLFRAELIIKGSKLQQHLDNSNSGCSISIHCQSESCAKSEYYRIILRGKQKLYEIHIVCNICNNSTSSPSQQSTLFMNDGKGIKENMNHLAVICTTHVECLLIRMKLYVFKLKTMFG